MYSYSDKYLYQELSDLGLLSQKVLDSLYEISKKGISDLYTLILKEGLVPDKNLG